MKIIALLLVVFFIGTVAAAETPELAEARRLGQTDALSKGFDWKFFAVSNLVSTSAPIAVVATILFIEESNVYIGTIDTINPGCCLAAYFVYNLTPTAIALLHSPAPPADRLLGKSPEWINAYTKAYQRGVKRARAEASIAGCFAGTASLAATTYLIISAVGGSTPGGY